MSVQFVKQERKDLRGLFRGEIMDVEEVLKRALEMEKDAIEEYTKMREYADPETAEMLDFMINEEQNHVKLINERLKAIRVMRK